MPNPIKILTFLILSLFFYQTISVTYKQFFDRQKKCMKSIPIINCITNPLADSTYGNVQPSGCPLDYYRSEACLAAFSKCTAIPQSQNDQIPVHCWNCIVQSPAESDIFKAYQDCLNSSAYHTIGFSLILLMVLAVILM